MRHANIDPHLAKMAWGNLGKLTELDGLALVTGITQDWLLMQAYIMMLEYAEDVPLTDNPALVRGNVMRVATYAGNKIHLIGSKHVGVIADAMRRPGKTVSLDSLFKTAFAFDACSAAHDQKCNGCVVGASYHTNFGPVSLVSTGHRTSSGLCTHFFHEGELTRGLAHYTPVLAGKVVANGRKESYLIPIPGSPRSIVRLLWQALDPKYRFAIAAKFFPAKEKEKEAFLIIQGRSSYYQTSF